MGAEFLLHGVVSGLRHSVPRLPVWRDDAIGIEKRIRKNKKNMRKVATLVFALDVTSCMAHERICSANHLFESPTARNLSNLYKSYKFYFEEY